MTKLSAKARLAILGLVTLLMVVVARCTGWTGDPRATTAHVQSLVQSAGAWGFVIFVFLYFTGVLAQIPGIVFSALGVLVWGPMWGGLASYAGATIASVGVFWFVRAVGGQPLSEVTQPFARKLFGYLEQYPRRVIAALYAVLGNAPQVNYALALSPVRTRDFAVAAAAGLVVPVLLQSWLLHALIRAIP